MIREELDEYSYLPTKLVGISAHCLESVVRRRIINRCGVQTFSAPSKIYANKICHREGEKEQSTFHRLQLIEG
jgi:hypothetical protein